MFIYHTESFQFLPYFTFITFPLIIFSMFTNTSFLSYVCLSLYDKKNTRKTHLSTLPSLTIRYTYPHLVCLRGFMRRKNKLTNFMSLHVKGEIFFYEIHSILISWFQPYSKIPISQYQYSNIVVIESVFFGRGLSKFITDSLLCIVSALLQIEQIYSFSL